MEPLTDAFTRTFYYLRLSITDVCNFKCNYCLPDGYRPQGRPSFLDRDELERVARAFAGLGTGKIRLTGGEPSLRKDFTSIIERIAAVDGIHTLATTTNGYRLAIHSREWIDAGLTHINVSMDSLDPRQFQLITGQNRFAQVMAGIDAVLADGRARLKVNAVLMRDLNDHELPAYLEWIRHRPVELRLIELMQTGEMNHFFDKHHLSGQRIERQLLAQGWQLQPQTRDAGPAVVYRHPDYQGAIGLIMPYSPDFCASCNRLRVSAKGKLHLCLFGEAGIELRHLLRSDDQLPALQATIREQLQYKKSSHFLHEGVSGATRNLAMLGG